MQTTAIADLPWAELSDLPNAQALSKNLADALDPLVIPRFTNAAARDAKITSPSSGQFAWLTGTNSLTVYDGVLGWYSINKPIDVLNAPTWGTNINVGTATYIFRKVLGLGFATAYVPLTATLTLDGSNNLPDKTLLTLPTQIRPTTTVGWAGDNGLYIVSGVVETNGDVIARAASANIASGTQIRFTATFPVAV